MNNITFSGCQKTKADKTRILEYLRDEAKFFSHLKKNYPPIRLLWTIRLPYARHYNPRFVYFSPLFEDEKRFFKEVFFRKFGLYVWLVFKSGL